MPDAAALEATTPVEADAPYDGGTDATRPPDGAPDAALGPSNLRVMAANLTSGSSQSYDPGEGLRIFEGLKPDVVLIQEFNYGANTDAAARAMVDAAFGPNFSYY